MNLFEFKLILLGFIFLGANFSSATPPDCTTPAKYKKCPKPHQPEIPPLPIVNEIKFEVRFIDPNNGVSWGKPLSVGGSNGCANSSHDFDPKKCTVELDANSAPILIDGYKQVRVSDSNAATLCLGIGARLPTAMEYLSLIRSIGELNAEYIQLTTGNPHLTGKGLRALMTLFELDSKLNSLFWTSSISSYFGERAFVFDGYWGMISSEHRAGGLSVICVR